MTVSQRGLKGRRNKTRKPQPKTPRPAALTVRITPDLREQNVPQRIKSIVDNTGLSESLITRRALALGLAQIEEAPALLLQRVAEQGPTS